MKYVIRLILTIPALLIFGIHGVYTLWKFGGVFTIHLFNPEEAVSLLRDLHDLQNGAPLEKYMEEWEDVMVKIQDFLEKHED